MYTIIIVVFIGIVFGIYFAWKYLYDIKDYFVNSFFGLFWGSVIGALICLALPMDKYEKQYSIDIVSLSDVSGISGSFFLGFGQIENKMQYIYYYQENGYYKIGQIDYRFVRIKYTDERPSLVIFEKCATDAIINKFSFDFDLHMKLYVFNIPKGSVKNNYNLDSR